VTQGIEPGTLSVRHRFGSRLSGEGVEIGPGHAPFPVPGGVKVKVRYIDRWEPAENSSLFPELGDSAGFPKPDIVANLDVERLEALDDESQDFVIASHILEHLANPLAMIVEIDRVLKVDGLVVLLLPDRHRTFDHTRTPTPLAHLVEEYRRDVREVDDAHVLDFIVASVRASGDDRDVETLLKERTAEEIALHRRRSVHAHVWDMHEFTDVLGYAGSELGIRWKVLDAAEAGGEGTFGNEFGWLFSKSACRAREGDPRDRRTTRPTTGRTRLSRFRRRRGGGRLS